MVSKNRKKKFFLLFLIKIFFVLRVTTIGKAQAIFPYDYDFALVYDEVRLDLTLAKNAS